MTIKFVPEKLTKNTVRFTEELASDMDMPKVGTIYIQKSALKELGYKENDAIEVSISIAQ